MTSEWDNTPWAGKSVAAATTNGLPNLPVAARKAVYGGPYLNSLQSGPMLSSLQTTPQQRAAAYLRAYKVGWFYKAERKISTDIGMLRRTVSPEVDGDNEGEVVEPDVRTPFEALDPIGQFLRLMERPNPSYTGRQLFTKTEIRLDMAGWAHWYLEGADFGLPTAIYGISPTRLWPEYDRDHRQVGWTLDKDSPSGGTPFSLDEILTFTTCTADDEEWYGQGVVEAVQANVPLSEMMSRHTADVLHTGGRLAGMMWPRERSLGEDEFNDARRAWRNVTSDPNAARRLLIFPEPMEYAQGASTPAEIGIPELANLDRDTVLSAFPMWPELLGIPMPAGLNASGEARKEIGRAYWEESIHPRVELLEDTIQVGLLARYEAVVGGSWDFDIEEPNLDDAGSLIEKAGAFKALISIGFDAKDAVAAVGLDGIKWNGLPDLLDPAKQAEMAAQAAEAKQDSLQVSVSDTSRQDRTETRQPIAKTVKGRDDVAQDHAGDLAAFLAAQRERTVEAIRETYPAAKASRKGWATKADPEWWDTASEDAALRAVVAELYIDAGRASLQVVADGLDRIVPNAAVKRIADDLMAYGGERIADINARTLQAITIELAEGSRRGYSITQLVEGVASENYKGVLEVGLENGVGVWGDARAEMIARTETALSMNRAAIQGYSTFGVQQVQAIDGDGDAECAARNGHVYSIDEALGLTDHPNGTLDWAPLVEKAAHEKAAPDIHLTVNIPDSLAIPAPIVEAPIVNLPAPVVNVEAPVVNVEAPVVTVPAPVVNVAPPDMTIMEAAVLKATSTVTDVRLVENVAPPRKRKVKRDPAGRITEITEE